MRHRSVLSTALRVTLLLLALAVPRQIAAQQAPSAARAQQQQSASQGPSKSVAASDACRSMVGSPFLLACRLTPPPGTIACATCSSETCLISACCAKKTAFHLPLGGLQSDLPLRPRGLGHSLALFGSGRAASVAPARQQVPQNNRTKDPEYVEPIITEETMPNEVGEWDFRFTSEYAKETGNIRSGLLPRFHVFFGIVRTLGGDLDVPMAYRKDSSSSYGVGDVSFGLKWLVAPPAGRRPAVVLGLETTFPSGNAASRLGEGTYELEPFLAVLKDFRRVLVQGNVGLSNRILTSAADPDEERRAFTYNWAAAFPFRARTFHLLAEVNGEVGVQSGRQIVAFSPGFKYRLYDQMFIAVAVPVGLTHGTKKLALVVQFQVGIGKRE